MHATGAVCGAHEPVRVRSGATSDGSSPSSSGFLVRNRDVDRPRLDRVVDHVEGGESVEDELEGLGLIAVAVLAQDVERVAGGVQRVLRRVASGFSSTSASWYCWSRTALVTIRLSFGPRLAGDRLDARRHVDQRRQCLRRQRLVELAVDAEILAQLAERPGRPRSRTRLRRGISTTIAGVDRRPRARPGRRRSSVSRPRDGRPPPRCALFAVRLDEPLALARSSW